MNGPNWAEVWTAYGTWATAIATLILAGIGWRGLAQWKRSLENQRADECISAARHLEGAIGRLVTLKSKRPEPGYDPQPAAWRAYSLAWESWRQFNQAFAVARRYHEKAMVPDTPTVIATRLREIEDLMENNWASGTFPKDQGTKFEEEAKQLLDKTVTALSG